MPSEASSVPWGGKAKVIKRKADRNDDTATTQQTHQKPVHGRFSLIERIAQDLDKKLQHCDGDNHFRKQNEDAGNREQIESFAHCPRTIRVIREFLAPIQSEPSFTLIQRTLRMSRIRTVRTVLWRGRRVPLSVSPPAAVFFPFF